jgi:hypothetical protein
MPWSNKSTGGGGGGLSDVVEDLTPQLGADLDLNVFGIDFPTTANITDVLDDDTMANASATKLATSESIKAYVDANAGAWKTVESQTISVAATNIDFQTGIDSTYDIYRFTWFDVGLDVSHSFQTYYEIGAAWVADAYYARTRRLFDTGGVGTNISSTQTETAFNFTTTVGAVTDIGITGTMYLFNPSSTTTHKSISVDLITPKTIADQAYRCISYGHYHNSLAAVTGVRFQVGGASDKWDRGTILLEGLSI